MCNISLNSLTQGTSADQDNRFSDKEKKLLNSMKFDESLGKKVDMKKVGMKTFLLLVLGFLLYLRVLEIPKNFRKQVRNPNPKTFLQS